MEKVKLRSRKRNCEQTTSAQPKPKTKYLSKNAVNARQNRIKKKQYIQTLEKNVKCMKDENGELQQKVAEQTNVIKSLQSQVQYLRNVLANSSDISQVLKCIRDSAGLAMTSSLLTPRPNTVNTKAVGVVKPVENVSMQAVPQSSSFSDTSDLSDVFSPADILGDDSNFSFLDDIPLTASALDTEVDFPYLATNEPFSNSLQEEHNYFSSPKVDNDTHELSSAGVCIHVSNKKISVEFCSICNDNALSAWENSFAQSLNTLS